MSRKPRQVRISVALLVAAAGIAVLGSPALAASPSPAPSSSASPSPTTPGLLSVTRVGDVDSNSYPQITATLSIIDGTTGRPESSLDAGAVSAPKAKVVSVTATTASLPTAYLLLLDTSGSMKDDAADGKTYMDHAKGLAKSFATGVGPNDIVKLATFDDPKANPKTTGEKTPWLAGSSASLTQAIDSINAEAGRTLISTALVWAAGVANARPAGYDRRAIVLITDASPADKDANLSSAAMRQQLGPATFMIGMRSQAQVGSDLTKLLSDVATYTGGSYQSASDNANPTTLFAPVKASTSSAWRIVFSTDAFPDSSTHQQSLTITDAQQRSGAAVIPYQSGPLSSVTTLSVTGLRKDERITADRSITASITGSRNWQSANIDLYLDCVPTTCSAPTQSARQSPLVWTLPAASLSQGAHRIWIRLTTSDGSAGPFTSEVEIDFTRTGTTWNFATVFLVGGIGLLLIGAFFIASRRRAHRPTFEHTR
jgi:Mg-chelatase subunit ChlD